MADTLGADYFDRVYAAKADPWDFETSEYEAAKYRRTLATLPRAHYDRAFEIGCSIGILTAQLAPRCGSLLAVDVSRAALDQARACCAAIPNVTLELLAVPREYPEGAFDLTIVSEVGYYLSFADLEELGSRIELHTTPTGQLLLVHWLPKVDDYPLTGDQVHAYFLSLPAWTCIAQFKAPQYRIELLQLSGSRSAAD